MRIKTTRYGLSVKAGYWDTYGDSSTDNFLGDGKDGHTLTTASCALTRGAANLLGIKEGAIIRIVWDDKTEQFRRYDDTAPEDEPRVDLFYPYADHPLPDFGDVTVVCATSV